VLKCDSLFRGEKATFESWGDKTAAQVAAFFELVIKTNQYYFVLPTHTDSICIPRHSRANIGPNGSLFVPNPVENPDELGWIRCAPTPYQLNNLGITTKFILGTRSSASRRDLVLKPEAMPKPIFFRPNTYEWNGVPVPPPSTWAALQPNAIAAGFDAVLELLEIADIVVLPTPSVRK
jgi:hypothetical protein